ncbi:hypothetical protein FBZ98_101102 [Rhizobium sp. ERR 922]|nr:hypothetical protein FBZ98_101102 [Rhizobium sp. ERR 922]TWC03700.1 hypothetical protein FBZ97_101102 [Rhizobium sp. ERR 942]
MNGILHFAARLYPPLSLRDISPTRGEIVWSMLLSLGQYQALITADVKFV